MGYGLEEWLCDADKNHYAIPAFNYSDQWELYGIIAAAQEMRSPVMVASLPMVACAHGTDILKAVVSLKAREVSVPVFSHLDHANDFDICKMAVDSGYASVMIDGSPLPLDENIALTNKIAGYARPRGVCVEGEIGRIRGKNAEGCYLGDDFLVDVEAAVRMANECDITSLAIGIGTAHGFYKKKPELNFKRLDEVNKATDIPLVLHGCSGLAKEDVQQAIRLGINKVNIGTQLHYTYLNAMRKYLNEETESTNIIAAMKPVVEGVKNMVMSCIDMCMSQNRV